MYSTLAVSVVAALGSALAVGPIARVGSGSSVDPCSLLTTAQVSKAIGGAAAAGQAIGTTGCAWRSTAPKAMVTLSFFVPGGFARLKASRSPVIVTTPVSGVGDDAFYQSAGGWTTLTVKKGTTVFVVRAYGFTDPAKQKQIEKALAADAAARL